MSAGKLSAQTGHAYLDSYLNCVATDSVRAMKWKSRHHGIKVCLRAKNLVKIMQLKALCEQRNIPHALVEDLGYTCFGGKTTITALGIGPIHRDDLPELRKLSLMK